MRARKKFASALQGVDSPAGEACCRAGCASRLSTGPLQKGLYNQTEGLPARFVRYNRSMIARANSDVVAFPPRSKVMCCLLAIVS